MEIKQLICVSSTKGQQVFSLHIPVGTTWGNAVDAASEILAEVCNMAKQSMDQAKPAASPAEPVTPTIVEGQ